MPWKYIARVCISHPFSTAPAELFGQGVAIPPVSPEVINILLFRRSCRLHDALAEHVDAMKIFAGILSQSSILSSSCGAVQARGGQYLWFHRRLLKSFSFGEAAGCTMLLQSMSMPWKYQAGLCRSHPFCAAPAELDGQGVAIPPVSPEVINILLFRRSCRLHDALAEHVDAMEIFAGIMSQSSILSSYLRSRSLPMYYRLEGSASLNEGQLQGSWTKQSRK